MKLIVCVDENLAIGYKGNLIFKIPDDLKFFREKTLGSTVVMGRKTYEALPSYPAPLPDRKNIVLTRDTALPKNSDILFMDFNKLLEKINKNEIDRKNLFVIGGAEIYNLFFDMVNTIYLTKVYSKAKNADTFFINLDSLNDWKLTKKWQVKEHENLKYQFFKYERL